MARRVIVVGGGAMGLASAWALARRGAAVTVLERHGHVHDLGSHGGHTRIIREAYHEGGHYVRLVREAERAWRGLEARAGVELLRRTGLLEFGPERDPELRAAIEACLESQVEHTLHDAGEVAGRWPSVRLEPGWIACYSPAAGFLRVKPCMDALRVEAEAAGAVVRHGVRVERILVEGTCPEVLVEGGERLAADAVVVSAGAYTRALLPALAPGALFAQRKVLAWTDPAPRCRAELATLPVWAAFCPEGFFYGFPYGEVGARGFKIACHRLWGEGDDAAVDPEAVDRDVDDGDLAPLASFLARHLPAGQGPFIARSVCLYGRTRSWDFLIDHHPARRDVVIAAGFSGHGFKFAPAIGRMVADLVDGQETDNAAFRRGRHASSEAQ
ncbi:MAG: N-methyl-L-tryptophan oxidase [Myxococcales bacterium]|nr:N-methyl-L-tryptophan oxidase [Myxococcales bacterium]